LQAISNGSDVLVIGSHWLVTGATVAHRIVHVKSGFSKPSNQKSEISFTVEAADFRPETRMNIRF